MGAKKYDNNFEFLTDMTSDEKNTFELLLKGDSQVGNASVNIIKKLFK